MWWSRIALAAVAVGTLATCGFEPAYAPGGPAEGVRGLLGVAVPADEEGFAFVQRLEERLGEADGPLTLSAELLIDEEAVGIQPDGTITRYNVQGAALWQIRDGDALLANGEERSFTSYSATSTTVATIFARRDARERLMKILADRVVADILRTAPEWRP